MLTPDQYQAVVHDARFTTLFKDAIAEYESANPPKPVAVNCSVCGSKPNYYLESYWGCPGEACEISGPVNDPDAAKHFWAIVPDVSPKR